MRSFCLSTTCQTTASIDHYGGHWDSPSSTLIYALRRGEVLEVKRLRVCKLIPDPLIHSIDVCLVYCHASFGKRRSIVDGNIVTGLVGL
ncbi:cleavage and polyadenylation specificity factor subunit 3-I [Iris pallida]|uniref:Cleavage and polyadenylation specificity factor subunit 3-I n=1 Tax=Iris pallida TaxID=29817 RepID=A0AAX6DH09_IRIPA|nr:cleavage and polyadenylation specificity factor subunit 3-I [Iris pallida]KAJ6825996.1 cleavage and polyadenylation specificity factor subunit 3-I [Iris pallida]KAJ6836726.1 cleavage and polyadenylation specificity factor subunit 3-I [Iris pallida]KAJ6844914.1 cleavage and polyadenylation specificity factor subunit 3-I [Iris pallida]